MALLVALLRRGRRTAPRAPRRPPHSALCIFHSAFLLSAVLLAPAGAAPAPRLAAGSELTDAGRYNVLFTLAARQPVRFLFAADGQGSGYVLELTSTAASLSRLDAGRETRLASARANCLTGKAVNLTVKRRPGVLLVERERRLLLRAYDDRYAAGSAGAAEGTPAGAVRDVLLQPVGEPRCGDDFLPDSQVAREWDPLAGEWRIGSYRDPMMGEDQGPVGASWYAARGSGPCLSVGGYAFWDDLAMEVTARAVRGTSLGLVFNCRDARNYGLFRLTAGRPGTAAIEEVVDGRSRRVAAAPWSGDLAQWRRLRLETAGTFARALVDGEVAIRGQLSAHTDGRVGLFADGGTEAEFDDLSVAPFSLLSADLRGADIQAWQCAGGAWRSGVSGLGVRPASPALAIARAGEWSDLDATLEFTAPEGSEAGLAFRVAPAGDAYRLTCGEGKWSLSRVEGGRITVLASAPARAAGPRRLRVRATGGRLQAFGDGDPLPLAYDFALAGGTLGLFAAGPATFARLEAAGPHSEPEVPLFETDFAAATLRGLNQEEYLRVLGDYLEPAKRTWEHDAKAGVLKARAEGSAWFHETWGGDAIVGATVSGPAAAGLLLAGNGTDADSGYRLSLSGKDHPSLRLFRRGKAVAEAEAARAGGPTEMDLRRDGAFVVGRAGVARLAFRDPEPLRGSRAGVWAGGPGAVLDDFHIGLAHAIGTRFDHVDPDWRVASGSWQLHSGMTCVPWTYWVAADGRKEPVLVWNRHPLPGDFETRFRVSEHSIGDEQGHHQHFPYHDIRLTLCGDPTDPSRGYTLLVGAERSAVTRLLRNGKVVAESRSVRIVMGSHCNDPRQILLRARKEGGKLEFWGNGARILQFQDPAPLTGGQLALGLAGCEANFRDFVAARLGVSGE